MTPGQATLRSIQALGLLLYLVLLSPFLLVALLHFVLTGARRESLYARAVYRVPLLYEIHNRIFTFPIWEDNFRSLPPLPGRTLHLACGTGFGAGVIETRASETVHLDIQASFLRFGKRLNRMRRVVAGDAYRLPFRAASFDRIVVPVAFHHLLDHRALFAEAKRVMREGGRLLIFDPVSLRPRRSRVMNSFHDGPIWIFDRQGILDSTGPLLEANGLELRNVHAFRPISLQNYNVVYPMMDMILEVAGRS